MNAENETLKLDDDTDELLEQVEDLGAATAIELAVKTTKQPDEVRPKLERLRQAGLLKVRRRHSKSDYERDIYLLSPEGEHRVTRARQRRLLDTLVED